MFTRWFSGAYLAAWCCFATQVAYAHSDADDRIHEISHQLKKTPTSELLLRRALFYLEESNYKKARRDIRRAQRTSKKPIPEALWLGARVELAARKPDATLRLLDELARRGPPSNSQLTLRARALRMKGDPKAAAPLLAQVVAHKPGAAGSVLEYADALLDSNRPTAARDALEAGVAESPDSTVLRIRLFDLLMEGGFDAKARTQLRALPKKLQQSPKYLHLDGIALRHLGKTRAACERFARADLALQALPTRRRSAPAFTQIRRDNDVQRRHCRTKGHP